MNFFPTPYPGELLYSILGRYAVRSGNIGDIHNFEDLFSTRSCIATVELPSRLNALIKNMPINSEYTAEYFINNHTLFPFYAAFISPDRAEEIIDLMKNGKGDVSYIKIGLVSNSIPLNKYFKFCPKCFKEDIDTFGEPYWHRVHQVTGVLICPKHKIPIYNSKDLIRGGNRQRFIISSIENCIVEEKIEYPQKLTEKMIWMVKDAEILLKGNYDFRSQEWFKSQFRARLIEKGYARLNNYIHQKKLREDFINFYSEEYLDIVKASVSTTSQNWLSSMVRNNNRNTYVLRYLLLARFLEIPIDTLFNKKIGLDTENDDLKEDNIDAYQELWDEKLKELVKLNLSIREIAATLNSTPKTIRKSIDKLDIKPFWKYNGGGRYLKKRYIDTDEFKTKLKTSREQWLELLDKYPNKSSNKIKQNNQALYRWLTKYDIEWLRSHARSSDGRRNIVNWEKRDAELIEKVKLAVKAMEEGKPERITWTTIGSRLGVSGWLSKRRDKLPQTKEYIESVKENLRDFQIRKIKWAIDELDKNDKEITFWNLSGTAGVKPRYMESIKENIKSIILKKGHDCKLF
ncbi:TnsD family Tn7-like transposition protein [Defluviitalea saccharophila]|uniref:TnsD family Tn7-like transposition protein n=1 Tax=Defluviitalea saccharophila TaxID=879970 RepID=A0ABZ2Y222_9FIRM